MAGSKLNAKGSKSSKIKKVKPGSPIGGMIRIHETMEKAWENPVEADSCLNLETLQITQ
jgi:hypothetical protein